MKNKLLAAGLAAGVILGGTFAAGASEKDDTGRKDDSKVVGLETEVETEHGKMFIKKEAAPVNSETGSKKLTVEQATEIAKQAANGRIEEIETEFEHGRLEYHFEFKDGGKETDVRIDAITGKVTRVELDNDDWDENDRNRTDDDSDDWGYDDNGGSRTDDDSDDWGYDDNGGNRSDDADDSGHDGDDDDERNEDNDN